MCFVTFHATERICSAQDRMCFVFIQLLRPAYVFRSFSLTNAFRLSSFVFIPTANVFRYFFVAGGRIPLSPALQLKCVSLFPVLESECGISLRSECVSLDFFITATVFHSGANVFRLFPLLQRRNVFRLFSLLQRMRFACCHVAFRVDTENVLPLCLPNHVIVQGNVFCLPTVLV